jgi:hypothetical protein
MRIPIKTYLHKYLLNQLGTEKFILQKYSNCNTSTRELLWQKRLSDLIFPLLITGNGYKPEEIGFKNFVYMAVFPSNTAIREKRMSISSKGVQCINNALYTWFMEDLQEFCDEALSTNQRIDMRILKFMSDYNIDEDDIRFDSLKKNYYRERVKTSQKIFTKNYATAQLVLDLSFSNKLIQS